MRVQTILPGSDSAAASPWRLRLPFTRAKTIGQPLRLRAGEEAALAQFAADANICRRLRSKDQ